ncbi:MAG: amino acid adenylation domain-containing protein, partial [Lutisporaceae bacterium]
MSKKLQKHMIAASSQYHLEKEYWVNKLSYVEPCEFPYDRVNKNIPEIALDYIEFDYPEQTSLKLDNISNASYKNMLYILLASVAVLLHKYTGKTDLITATPIYKQENDNESEFINTILPLRSSFDKNISFKELLINIKNTVSEAVKYQNYPIEVLANELNVSSDLYFQTVVMLENLQDMQYIQDLNTNMVFVFNKTVNNLKCKLYYNTLLYKENTVVQIAEHMTNLLDTILTDIDIKICDINILTEKEQQRLLVEFNNTKADYPRDKTIHELFDAQVQKTPDKVAVVCEEKQLTYRELNERANQLAHLLREKGITRDSIVGLWTERSLEMIIGILGILKAGGAYLPIDTNYPQDRIEYILEDSGAKLLLTQSLLSKKAVFRQEIILLDDESLYEGAVKNPEKINQPNDLAYIIYTSGSTGKPKGVMIEHHALINRINWMQKKYPISEQDVVLQKTAYTFDVSVWELLWWSQVGATLCLLVPGGEKDPRQIAQAIEKNRVTVMHFVPSMLNIFMEYLQINDVEGLSSIRQVFASGEALMPYQVEKFNAILSNRYGTALANLYGPTEAAIDVSYFDCIGKGQLERVPIGKPIDNISLYILDESKNVQPIGVSGELYIAGVGLARGYLNNTTLTAEKFVDNPFETGTKMYRTGDLARWLSDGNIEFLGRIDHQVKTRGYRIELGEIETQLLSYQGVKEVIATAKEDNSGSKYLCAYLV